jgi:hypothetical protein
MQTIHTTIFNDKTGRGARQVMCGKKSRNFQYAAAKIGTIGTKRRNVKKSGKVKALVVRLFLIQRSKGEDNSRFSIPCGIPKNGETC